MENSPPSSSSLEKQIDNFLEHFKRSASKAMEAEWCSIGGNSGVTAAGSSTTTTNTSTTAISTENSCTQHTAKQVTTDKHHLLQRTRSRSSCLDLNNMMMESSVTTTSPAELDAELFSTLCEIDKYNYLYLFERCKLFNVYARQLRFFEKDHIRELIPNTQLGILAEFEYLLNEWKILKGLIKPPIIISAKTDSVQNANNEEKSYMPSKRTQTDEIATRNTGVNTLQLQRCSTSNMIINEDSELFSDLSYADNSMDNSMIYSPRSCTTERQRCDHDPFSDHFPLEKIVPLVLKKCTQNYKIKKLLTESDRRLLASSIVDYFGARKIKLRPNVMDNLAEQIAQHFPTEGKKAWYHRENSKGRGRLYMRFYNSHRTKEMRDFHKKRKLMAENAVETIATADSDAPVSSLLDDMEAMDNDENGKRIQSWLKLNMNIKCEDFSEIVEMWDDTLKYRHLQMKYLNDLESVREFLESWPSYKLARGHELLSMDFAHRYPNALDTFHTRWLVYKQNIVALLDAELKDNHCLEILTKYQAQKDHINEDSSSCALIYMLHAITKPFRVFKTATGNVRYCITDSQYSMTRLIHNLDEIGEYQEAYPCIFVLGETLLDIRECYVVFLGIKYRLSYADCLVVCMQLYSLLKLEDPLPSLHFWQFVRGYLFNMPRENERPYAVMESVVSYLESTTRT